MMKRCSYTMIITQYCQAKESEKMGRSFNVTGLCIPEKHYMVDFGGTNYSDQEDG